MVERNDADLRAALAACVEEMKGNNSMAIRGTKKDTIATSHLSNLKRNHKSFVKTFSYHQPEGGIAAVVDDEGFLNGEDGFHLFKEDTATNDKTNERHTSPRSNAL